jgi:tyrosinase
VESSIWGKPIAGMLAVTPNPQNGDNGPTLTLNYILALMGIIPDATIKDIIDIRGDYLCWEYW